jgi:hypothetical protein
MEDAAVAKCIELLTQQVISLDKELTNLRASVTAVKGAIALQLSPNDPLEGAKMLRKAEELILSRDPHAQALEDSHEVIEAIKLWKKHGSHES